MPDSLSEFLLDFLPIYKIQFDKRRPLEQSCAWTMNHKRNSSWTTTNSTYKAWSQGEEMLKKMSKILKVFTIIRPSQCIFCFQLLGLDSWARLPIPHIQYIMKGGTPTNLPYKCKFAVDKGGERVHSSTDQLFSYCTIEGIFRRDTRFQAETSSLAQTPLKANIFGKDSSIKL